MIDLGWLATCGLSLNTTSLDALTTYLLWLRTAHFAGHFSDEAHAAEVERVRDLLHRASPTGRRIWNATWRNGRRWPTAKGSNP